MVKDLKISKKRFCGKFAAVCRYRVKYVLRDLFRCGMNRTLRKIAKQADRVKISMAANSRMRTKGIDKG